jgi:hypothetical protein
MRACPGCPGIRDSQDLFDDLTDDPADHAVDLRDRAYLTCRLDLARNRLVVERTRGRAWMRITPGQAG